MGLIISSSALAGGSTGTTGAGKTLLLLKSPNGAFLAQMESASEDTQVIRVNEDAFKQLQESSSVSVLSHEFSTQDLGDSISASNEDGTLGFLIIPATK